MIYITDDRARVPKGVIPVPVGRTVVAGLLETQEFTPCFIGQKAAASVSYLLNQWMFNTGTGIALALGDILITCEILCDNEVPSDVHSEDVQFIMYKV